MLLQIIYANKTRIQAENTMNPVISHLQNIQKQRLKFLEIPSIQWFPGANARENNKEKLLKDNYLFFWGDKYIFNVESNDC